MIKYLVELIGHIQAPFVECKITSKDYFYLCNSLKDGDVIFTRSNGYFSNFFIKGFYTHASIFSKGMIYEAVGTGVRKQTIFDFVKDKDYLIVRQFNQGQINPERLNQYCERVLGTAYDFLFSDNEKFYCSEFVDMCYGILDLGYYTRRIKSFGKLIILPQILAEHGQFRTIYTSEQHITLE